MYKKYTKLEIRYFFFLFFPRSVSRGEYIMKGLKMEITTASRTQTYYGESNIYSNKGKLCRDNSLKTKTGNSITSYCLLD